MEVVLPLTIWNSCLSKYLVGFLIPQIWLCSKVLQGCSHVALQWEYILAWFFFYVYFFIWSDCNFIHLVLACKTSFFINFKLLWISHSYNNVNPWFSIFNSCNNPLIHLFCSAKMIPNHYFDFWKVKSPLIEDYDLSLKFLFWGLH